MIIQVILSAVTSWQFNLICYLVFIVIFFQGYKLAVKNSKKDGASTILLQLIAGISVLVFLPFHTIKFPTDIKYWVLMFAACVFYALNDRLQTTVRKHLPVSTYSITGQLSTILIIVIGILFFKNPPVISKILGASLILFANSLLVYKKGGIKINKHIWLSALAAIAYSVGLSLDIGISNQFNYLYTLL